MKAIRYIAVLALTVLMTASCYSEIDGELTSLERRVANLNQRLNVINENIAALQTLADKYISYKYVVGYLPIYQGKQILGYTIHFSDGSTVTLRNGVSKDDPIVGLRLDDNGLYYWVVTVNGVTDFFYDETGQKIPASVASPVMKIVDGVWNVSLDNGKTWQTFGRAQGAEGYSFIESITTRGDYIYIKLVSGQTVSFPAYSLYENYLRQLNDLNANMDVLRTVYEAKASQNYVRNVIPVEQDGSVTGYTLVFSDGQSITVYNGQRSEGPEIGLAQFTDGKYYWATTEDGEISWMYDDVGAMVMASPTEGVAPIFVLDDSFGDGKYYWAYKYGASGTLRYLYDAKGNKVVASNANVVRLFKTVEVTDTYVLFTPLSGTAFSIARYKPFTVTFDKTSVTVPKLPASVQVKYEVKDVTQSAAITAVASTGYYASVTRSYDAKKKVLGGTVTITADDATKAASTVLVMVSDGQGHMETYKIAVKR